MKTFFIILGIIVIGVVGYTIWAYRAAPAPQPIVRPAPVVTTTTVQTPAVMHLEVNGIGDNTFGTATDTVINNLTTRFGKPSKDTGNIESFSAYGTCPGEKIRVVEWGRLRAFFGDTTYGKNAFFHYEYTDRDSNSLTPVLATDKGITLQSTESALKTAYPSVTVTKFEEGGWSQFVIMSDKKTGASFGGNIGDTDKIYWIDGGIACGE